MARRDRVELGPREHPRRTSSWATFQPPPELEQPLAGRRALRAVGDVQQRLAALVQRVEARRAREARGRAHRTPRRLGVDQARQHAATAEVDLPRPRARQRPDVGVAARGHDRRRRGWPAPGRWSPRASIVVIRPLWTIVSGAARRRRRSPPSATSRPAAATERARRDQPSAARPPRTAAGRPAADRQSSLSRYLYSPSACTIRPSTIVRLERMSLIWLSGTLK